MKHLNTLNPIQHLYFRSKAQPDAIAMQGVNQTDTYRDLLRRVRAIAYKLRTQGIEPGQRIITFVPNIRTHWILTLALMHEAVVSCGNHSYTPVSPSLDVDWAIAARPFQGVPSEKMILLNDDWLRELPQVPRDFSPRAYESMDSLWRLVLTSGTTGQSKVVGFTVGRSLTTSATASSLSKSLISEVTMLGLSTGMGIWYGTSKLLAGGIFYHCLGPKAAIALIHSHRVQHLCGSPVQLAEIANEMKHFSLRLTSLQMVTYVGGQLSPGLLQTIRSTLCPNVACLYGSTEAGLVATGLAHDPAFGNGQVGYVAPEVDVQIVGGDQEPLGYGEEGDIWVRAPFMAQEYIGDPVATAKYFRDGWFYAGDRGSLRPDGMLTLSGRQSEVINRGGVKIDPAAVDRQLLDHEGIVDAAAFAYEDGMGLTNVAAAIVSEQSIDAEQLKQDLRIKLGTLCPSAFMQVQSIPRNAMGKPMRYKLEQEHAQALQDALKTPRSG